MILKSDDINIKLPDKAADYLVSILGVYPRQVPRKCMEGDQRFSGHLGAVERVEVAFGV